MTELHHIYAQLKRTYVDYVDTDQKYRHARHIKFQRNMQQRHEWKINLDFERYTTTIIVRNERVFNTEPEKFTSWRKN